MVHEVAPGDVVGQVCGVWTGRGRPGWGELRGGAPGSGTSLGQKPLQMRDTIRRTADSNTARQLKCCSLVERQMVIKGGQVMVSA